jgi:hypothetical protein
MIAADLNPNTELLWHEAVNCANDLENISANTGREASRRDDDWIGFSLSCNLLQVDMSPFARSSRRREKSVKCIFCGYAKPFC